MSRKKYNPRNKPSFIGELSVFARRLSEQIKSRGMTQKKVADYLGVQRQTVSLYTKGQALPDISTLTKITQLFDVSADYLLGITDTASYEPDKRIACEYTGLSEEAVDVLDKMAKDKSKYSLSKILTDIITNEHFNNFMKRTQQFIEGDSEIKIYPYSNKAVYDYVMADNYTIKGASEEEAEMYASEVDKRLISPEDLAHFYRKLSIEILERILLDIPQKYLDDYLTFFDSSGNEHHIKED